MRKPTNMCHAKLTSTCVKAADVVLTLQLAKGRCIRCRNVSLVEVSALLQYTILHLIKHVDEEK